VRLASPSLIRRRLDWSLRLREVGTEPDPRFSFANERTFLSWIRTSLALMAAGLGVDSFATQLPSWGRTTLAVALNALGGILAASSFGRWRRAELALRQAKPLPSNPLAPLLAGGLALVALLAIVQVMAAL